MGKPISKYPDEVAYRVMVTDGSRRHAWLQLHTMSRVPHPEELTAIVGRSDHIRQRHGLGPLTAVRVDRVLTFRGEARALHPTPVGGS